MWRETNLFGVYLPPLLIYAAVALVLWLPLRWLMLRWRIGRRLENPAILQLTLYLCLLAALVTWF